MLSCLRVLDPQILLGFAEENFDRPSAGIDVDDFGGGKGEVRGKEEFIGTSVLRVSNHNNIGGAVGRDFIPESLELKDPASHEFSIEIEFEHPPVLMIRRGHILWGGESFALFSGAPWLVGLFGRRRGEQSGVLADAGDQLNVFR